VILDSSAIVGSILRQQGHESLLRKMESAVIPAVGAPTLVEVGLVMVGRFDLRGRALVSQFLEEREPVVIPFDDRHARVADDAFIRYGKGRHPAALNYGDCMTYATAKLADLPLLFTGEDFAKTDLPAA
jgi:ribonuclease VapC